MAAAATQNYDNYEFLRRGSKRTGTTTTTATHTSSVSPSRAKSHSHRQSFGTMTSALDSANTSDTHITQPPTFSKKFVVVGDGGCGKTCLLISYSQGYFPQKYVPTVFENYITHTEHKPSGKVVELALWDTAGQEEYDRLRPLSYPDTDLIFVCFAIDCPNSLENVMDKWYPEVLHFCPTTPLMLVGLKSDLRHKRACIDMLRTQGLTPVTQEQGKTVAQQMGALYHECSSKEMNGVDEIFELAINTAVGREIEMKEERERWAAEGAASKGGNRKIKKSRCRIL